MEPLYCFKYDDETGKIIRYVITNYKVITGYEAITNAYTKEVTYLINNPEFSYYTYYDIPDKKLDRYVNGKVFTFKDDLQYVKGIIFKTLMDKRDKAINEYAKLVDKLETFIAIYEEFATVRPI